MTTTKNQAPATQLMQKITTAYGRVIDSKVFAVGERVEHNGYLAVVVQPNAEGFAAGHVLLRSDRGGPLFVAWANHCNCQAPDRQDAVTSTWKGQDGNAWRELRAWVGNGYRYFTQCQVADGIWI
jgi:hypothetical protein